MSVTHTRPFLIKGSRTEDGKKKKKNQSSPFLSSSFFINFFLIHKFYANWNMVEFLQKISFYNYKNQQLSSSKGEKICYFCGSTKHVSSDCPLYA